MTRRPNIHDVAKRAGVSTATVSHVLTESRTVRESTRTAVLEAVEELGYRRNKSAAALRKGSSDSVTVIVPDITNPFHAEIVAGLEDEAEKMDSSLSLMSANLDQKKEARYLRDAMGSDARAVVFLPMNVKSLEEVRHYFSRKSPRLILTDSIAADSPFSTISVDNPAGGSLVAEHFARIGRKASLVAGAPAGLPTSSQRVGTFVQRARELGIVVKDEWLTYGARRTADAADSVMAILEANPEIDSVFAGGDLLAVHIMKQLRNRGVKIPEDIAVCGFDDIDWAELVSPTLTTVRQPLREIGRHAARLGLASDNSPKEDVLLPVELIVRESTIGQ
ncbi:MAG: LacI family DNA-binding transcriptional regulator [Flaviflexus sp.]|uniref:LacI family DNA-binding transcriptional regulator n=1 Tax=Flaviflexus sp. TaxID=1969482 RepID=UPI00352F19D5